MKKIFDKKYKVIATDFDDTLLNSKKELDDSIIKILKEYQDNNFLIFGVTARSIPAIEKVCDKNIFNYLVACNGSFISDIYNNIDYTLDYINYDDVLHIYNYFNNLNIDIVLSSSSNYYVFNENKKINSYYEVLNSIDELNDKITKITIFSKDINHLKHINDNLLSIEAFFMRDSTKDNTTIVVMKKGINKKVGLEFILNKLNISLDEVIFFGDGPNDVEVMSYVGLPVAVDNAICEVKKISKDITLSSDNAGVGYYLEKNKKYIYKTK